MNAKAATEKTGEAVRSTEWLARNAMIIYVILAFVDCCAFIAARPRPENHWYYYVPAVGGWIALHDKINAR